MKKIMMLLFAILFTGAYTFAQVPEGQPEQQREQQEGQLEGEAPEQQPQQLEQEGEATPPGQEESEMERPEEGTEGELEEESDPMQQEGEASIDRFEDAKTMRYRQLPDPVKNDLENGYFSDWEVKDVYAAQEVRGNHDVPADFIIKVEKEDERLNLYYQSNGELLMQEKGELHENI